MSPSAPVSPSKISAPARYSIEEVDPDPHRDHVVRLLGRNLPVSAQVRFDKYYVSHPFGPVRPFLARPTAGGAPIGTASLFPARLRVAGEVFKGGFAGDFAIERSHRGFGPALLLQRAVLARASAAGLAFVLANPNPASEPVFRRLRYRDLGTFTRLLKPLAPAKMLSRRASASLATKALTSGATAVLRLASREGRQNQSDIVSFEEPSVIDERFAPLFRLWAARCGATGERTPELMNWKYSLPCCFRPHDHFSILSGIGSDGSVVAYVVFIVENDHASITDLLAIDRRAGAHLVAALVAAARARNLAAISFDHLGGPRWLHSLLLSYGFLPVRGPGRLPALLQSKRLLGPAMRSRLMVHVPESSPLSLSCEPQGWYLVIGDTDL